MRTQLSRVVAMLLSEDWCIEIETGQTFRSLDQFQREQWVTDENNSESIYTIS